MSITNLVGKDAVVRGDTGRLLLTVTRNSAAVDITGATFKFIAKRWFSDDVPLILKENDAFTVIDADEGTVVLTISPEDTQSFTDDMKLNYNVEMTESSGVITTVSRGIIEFKMDVGE